MTDPARPQAPLANGGMSRGGTTTIVKINEPGIEPLDKKVLCAAMCQCNKTPDVGVDGKLLKQACVSRMMREVDMRLDHRSPYKQEINYDMTKVPPQPIMDSTTPTMGHRWLPGWIDRHFGKGENTDSPRLPFKAGTGQIRRPDVVIVVDPAKAPTQDNIKQIVEMKFPPDSLSTAQEDAYRKIAGNPDKLKVLQPSDCDCEQREPEPPRMPAEQIGTVATILMWIAYILSRGRGPRPQPI